MTYKMSGFIVKYFERYCVRVLGVNANQYTESAQKHFDRLMHNAPDMGQKGNMMASNLDLTAAFFAYYEASDHKIDGKAIDILINWLYEDYKWLGFFTNMNKHKLVRKLYYKAYAKHAAEVERHRANGEWLGTWRIEINPEHKIEGIAYHMCNCPLLAFVKAHSYDDMMPFICKFDFIFERFLHARLIRTQTEATGGKYCDYWFVPDQSSIAAQYKDFKSV